jgi:hypothetical protein
MQEVNNDRSLNLKSLTPSDDAQNGDFYCQALSESLKEVKHYNIALTGGYGSGKSSVIETFCKRNENSYNFLRISLAAFNFEKPKNEISEVSSKDTAETSKVAGIKTIGDSDQIALEISLLQQLLYQADSSKSKHSRFERIEDVNIKRTWIYACLFFVTAITGLILWDPSILNNWTSRLWVIKNGRSWWFSTIIFLLFSPGVLLFLQYFFYLIGRLRVSKIEVSPIKLDLEAVTNISILNTYIDQIIHIFKANEYNVVFLEDIDRLNNHDIFAKLREINNLLRFSPETKDLKIKFVYAVRESIFKNEKDKNKFFDIIIPIVPIINHLNSKEKFLENFGLNTNLDNDDKEKRLIELISLASWCIDDLRTINNIHNEFIIYERLLKSDKVNRSKLLGVIIYKNLFPSDFENFHSGKSAIQSLFDTKQKLLDIKIIDLEEKREDLKKELSAINSERANDEEGLKELYVGELHKRLSIDEVVELEGKKIAFRDSMNKENFSLFIENGVTIMNDSEGTKEEVTFKEIESGVDLDYSYEHKLKLVRNGSEKSKSLLGMEISKLQDEIRKASTTSFSDLEFKLTATDFDLDINDNGIDKFKLSLIESMIRKRFIEEDYKHYISIFHPGSLTENDRNFLLSASSFRSLDINYKLDNPQSVINEFISSDWNRPTYFNIAFFDGILNQSMKATIKSLAQIVEMFKTNPKQSLTFLEKYLPLCSRRSFLIDKVMLNWPTFLQEFLSSDDISDIAFEQLIPEILIECDADLLKEQNKAGFITDFLSVTPNFINIISNYSSNLSKGQSNKLENALSVLNVEFEELEADNIGETLDLIYNNDHYSINRKMIRKMISLYSDAVPESYTYSSIKESACLPLIKYIDSSIDTFVRYFLLEEYQESESWTEENKFFQLLINDPSISAANKENLIKRIETGRSDFSDFEDKKLWPLLLDGRKIQCSWLNLIEYSEENSIDKILLEALKDSSFTDELVQAVHSSEMLPKIHDFFEKLICHKMEMKAFKFLLYRYGYYIVSKRISTETNLENLKWIIEIDYVQYDKELYMKFKEIFYKERIHLIFALKFQDDVLLADDDDHYVLDREEILFLLNDEKIKPLFITNIFIQLNDFESYEFGSKNGELLKDSIIKSNHYHGDKNILIGILKLNSFQDQVQLFNDIYLSGQRDRDDLIQLINCFNLGNSKISKPNTRTRLTKSIANDTLASNLLRMGLVNKINHNEDVIKINRNTSV